MLDSDTMSCDEIGGLLLDYQRGALAGDEAERVRKHLEGCVHCRRHLAADTELTQALAQKLPRHAAPLALQQRLAGLANGSRGEVRVRRERRYASIFASALATAAAVLLVVRVSQPAFLLRAQESNELVEEGVNDHLRVVSSVHPIEVESGGGHQVKPWFTGRLDFAPRISFYGDDQLQLAGGNVGYFRDRKAAVFVWKIRLHTATLFVFPAEGLSWPTRGLVKIGTREVEASISRGFNVLLWRQGELGYCLVSDVNREDLDTLASRVSAEER
jgi:anti-sigma factor RsiW